MEESEIEDEIGKLRYQMSQTDDDNEKAECKQKISELESELEDVQRRKKQERDSSDVPPKAASDQSEYKDSVEEDEEKEEEKKSEKEDKEEKEEENNEEQEEKREEQQDREENEQQHGKDKQDGDKSGKSSEQENSNRDDSQEQADKNNSNNKKENADGTNRNETSGNKKADNIDDMQTPYEHRNRRKNPEANKVNSGRSGPKGAKNGASSTAKSAGSTAAKSTATTTTGATATGAATTGATTGAVATGAATGAATAGATTAGTAAALASNPVGWVILAIILIIIIVVITLITTIGTLSFFSAMPGMVIEKVSEFFNNIWDSLEALFIGGDKAFVNDDDILNVAQYLHNMGYDLEGCGFVDRNGSIEFEKDENGNDTETIKKIDSKYIWSYLVAENRSYLIRNYNFNFSAFGSELINSLIELETPSAMNFGIGMINFDDMNWISSVAHNIANLAHVDRESEALIIKNVQGLKFKLGWPPVSLDAIVYSYSLKGWTGRYGKPLEFLTSMHLATMAPDLVYNIAMDERLDAIVHIKRHTADVKITPYFIDDDGEYTANMLEEKLLNQFLEDNLEREIKESTEYDRYYRQYRGGQITKSEYDSLLDKLEKKIKDRLINEDFEEYLENENVLRSDGSDSGMSYATLLKNLREGEKSGQIEIPYITWVENHWFRNVYFSYDGSVTIVENELAEDRKRWDKYDENGNLVTTHRNGVEVYDYNHNSTNEYEYTNEDDEMGQLGRIKIVEDIRGGIAQVLDGKRGETNEVIKSLILDSKYYIYDGTVETADRIKERDPDVEKENVKFTKDSLAAFSMLENTHTLDADYVYKDLKELLIELEYFEREDFIKPDRGVFAWFLTDYTPREWPERRSDKEVFEYGTLVRSESSINKLKSENPEGTIVNDGFSTGLDVASPLTGKIIDKGVDETTGEDYITIEVLDTGDIEEYKKYYYGEKKEVTLYQGTEDEEVVLVPRRIGYENVCAGYTMDIRGIQCTVEKGIGQYIEEGDIIGKTTSSDICLIFRDLDNAIVENLEEYFYDSFISKNGQDVSDMFGNQISQNELEFFAGVLTAEAGGSVEGCLAVAFSVYNRMAEGTRWKGPSLLGVLCAPGQYSTVKKAPDSSHTLAISYEGKTYYTKHPNENALTALQMFLGGGAVNPIGNRQCFRSTEYYKEHNMNRPGAINVGGNTFFRS